MAFSTLNESDLHRTLKNFYAAQYEGQTEVNTEGHVYDILSKDGIVIEIQTKNLAKLLPKLLDSINNGHKVILVHPLVITKIIELYNEDGKLLSKRKSPVKGSIYDLFRELTGIYPILLNKSFTLEVMQINITEQRVKTSSPVQAQNHRRRFKKDWIKTNKKLDEILKTTALKTAADYLDFLPEEIRNSTEDFSSKELKNTLAKQFPKRTAGLANLILWVFARMDLIEFTEKKSRSNYYKIKR